MINTLKEQKQLGDNWTSNNKEPNHVAITLNMTLAAKVFERVRTILTRVGGVTSMPLVYVVRHQLIPDSEDEDLHFGGVNSKYTSHDQEMTSSSPIGIDQ
jgi:hypothetical protein